MFNLKIIGAIAGLVLGVIVICFGVLKAFLLALFVLAGWFIGKFLMGEIDLIDLYERFMSKKRQRT